MRGFGVLEEGGKGGVLNAWWMRIPGSVIIDILLWRGLASPVMVERRRCEHHGYW